VTTWRLQQESSNVIVVFSSTFLFSTSEKNNFKEFIWPELSDKMLDLATFKVKLRLGQVIRFREYVK